MMHGRKNTKVNNQVSHPYKTTRKILFLYILLCIVSDNYVKGKFWTEW
jgi:hypothetical protein